MNKTKNKQPNMIVFELITDDHVERIVKWYNSNMSKYSIEHFFNNENKILNHYVYGKKKLLQYLEHNNAFPNKNLCPMYFDDDVIIMKATMCHSANLLKASERLKDDDDFMYILIKNNCKIVQYASARIKEADMTHHVMLKSHKFCLSFASNKFKDDYNYVEKAIKIDSNFLQYASTRLKNNRTLAIKSLTNKGINNKYSFEINTYKYLSNELKNDLTIIKYSLSNWGQNLLMMTPKIRDDHDIVMMAVSNCGVALKYASDRLKTNKQICLASIQRHLFSLEYIYHQLLNDVDIIVKLVNFDTCDDCKKINNCSQKQLIYSTINTPKFLNEIIAKSSSLNGLFFNKIYKFIDKNNWNNKEFVMKMLVIDSHYVRHASDKLKNDRDVVIKAIKIDGSCIMYTNNNFENDVEIIKICVVGYKDALNYASKELQNNVEIVKLTTLHNPSAFKYSSNEIKNNKDIALMAIKKEAWLFECVGHKLTHDLKFIYCCLKQNWKVYFYIPTKSQQLRWIVWRLVKSSNMMTHDLEKKYLLELKFYGRILNFYGIKKHNKIKKELIAYFWSPDKQHKFDYYRQHYKLD